MRDITSKAGPDGQGEPGGKGWNMEEDCLMESLLVRKTDASGILQDYAVVVKDSYDIKGVLTSNGSPVWRETHPPAQKTAPAVEALLSAGAKVIGKAVMDEMAYSLEGQNYHYGTPVNPACPDRIPGGSSSGTAVSVAKGLADIGLGGDTGGSVRVPASFCGIYGIRPTHGRVDISGSCPLAPSFDTVGWFAQNGTVLEKVGQVLLDPSTRVKTKFSKWLVATDAFDLCDQSSTSAIYDVLSTQFDKVQAVLGSKPEECLVAPKGVITDANTGSAEDSELPDWLNVFRVHQAWEIWQTHGSWIEQNKPSFGPGIAERFQMASQITKDEFESSKLQRNRIVRHLDKLLGQTGLLTIPTAAGPAPKKNLPSPEMTEFRNRLLPLTSIAGLGGLPQVTIPLASDQRCPVGLSLIGPRGSDEDLLEVAKTIEVLFKNT